jgi:hypothetical protein
MRRFVRFIGPTVLALGLSTWGFPAGASHNLDKHQNMDLEFQSGGVAPTHSDLAFWGDYAFLGYYTGGGGSPPGTPPRGGVLIFDISDPADPVLLRNFQCDGPQADPIVWDRNGNGVPDLLLMAVDSTMASPACGAPRVAGGTPTGWEGFRVIEMSDRRRNPFTTMTQVAGVYQDCGSHTITLWPGLADGRGGDDDDDDDGDDDDEDEGRDQGKLIVYSSSYPLGAGPTCGDTEYLNTANPYDGDPGSPANPLHGVIQVAEVPLANPAAAREIAQPPISYPGDPDGRIEWCERGGTLCPPAFEPAAVACHDIVVHMEHNMAGAACAEQGQVWEIDENGIPDTANPIMVADDDVTSGNSQYSTIPGAIDFFHSVMFNNEGTVVNLVDESFDFDAQACPPMTAYQPRPWNPSGGLHESGRMVFTDLDGNFLSDFQVGRLRPEAGAYCSAHMGMAVMDVRRDLLVNAWYEGGVDVIDFTDPTQLREIAYYDIAPDGDFGANNWSAYPYVGPRFRSRGPGGRGVPVYASDGVSSPNPRGMLVFRAYIDQPRQRRDHLNPQTMD